MIRRGWCGALGLMLVSVAAGAQSIDVPVGQRVVFSAEGRGVQIYRCDVAGGAGKWVFVAPEAQLYVGGAAVGMHGAGPVWSYRDGSSVHGKMMAMAPSANADSVSQLLLKGVDADGKGILGQVSYIQRTATKGGVAPMGGCDGAHTGAVSRVPYTAVYTFYAAQR